MAKRNDEEVKREVDRILQEVAVYEERAQQRRLTFVSMSEEELTETMQDNDPPVVFWGYAIKEEARRGEYLDFFLALWNRSSGDFYECYVFLFFGFAAHFMPNIEWALLLGRDAQWPIRQADWPVYLRAGDRQDVWVGYRVPDNAPLGRTWAHAVAWNYAGAFSGTPRGIGSVLARMTLPPIWVLS